MNEYTDYSKINEKELLANRGPSVNLGLRKVRKRKGNSQECYKLSRWCGCCWLKKQDGSVAVDSDGNREVLRVKCRFDALKGDCADAVTNMLSVIAQDEEYVDYLCLELPEEEHLILFSMDEEMLPAAEISEDNRLITTVSYIKLLERVTRRFLIHRTIRRTENLTGKVRGSILFNKHIARNIAGGREDRIYCRYTEKTVDTPENRFLKYALKQAASYLQAKFPKLFQNLQDCILVCRRRLAEVSDVSCTATELDGTFLSAMYAAYRPALQLAKVILMEMPVDALRKNEKMRVIPYAINMPLLFECYVRTRIKEALEKINQNQYRAVLLPFVADKKERATQEGSCLPVFEKDGEHCYIRGNLVPDIVIAYYRKDGGAEEKPEFYRIYDVKYKDRERKVSDRNDRLQILAYDFMYHSNNNMGHIFPAQKNDNKCENHANTAAARFAYGKMKVTEVNEKTELDVALPIYMEYFLSGCAINIKNGEADWLTEE